MTKIAAKLLCLLIISFFLILPQTAKADPTGPAQFIQQLGHTALMSLTEKDMPSNQREARVRQILQDNFDVQTIGKFALGPYWNTASETERKDYMNLFETMIVQTYTSRFENYSGQALKVDRFTPGGGKDFIVDSQILQNGGPPINVQWRVRDEDGALRVVDVIIDGISMSVTQRSDFAATIQKGGGTIDALLTSMRTHEQENE
jgi:phospholipid transport system substrate-binding protein